MKQEISYLTHGIAVILAGLAAFFATHAGQALIMQYPWLMSVSSAVTVMALYMSPYRKAISGVVKAIVPFLLALSFSCVPVKAQTPTPAPNQYQVGAGYTSVSGPTDNGTLLTLSKAFSPRVWVTAKSYLLANPSGVIVATLGPRYRPPLSALFKPSAYFDTTKWYPFVDLNLGVVKDPTGKSTFAYGVGVGLDYEVSESVTMLLLQVDYDRSKFFPSGGILLGNPQNYIQTIATGIKFSF